MTSFTDIYSGLPINPTEVAYNPLTISANTALSWPSVAVEGDYIAAGIMQITATTIGLEVLLPDATQASPGTSILFQNVGSHAFTVTDSSGNTVQSCAPGLSNYIYLTNNTTTTGSWAVILFGANSATVNASALAGAGLLAIATTLNQNSPITAVSGSYTLGSGDRANTIRNTGGSVAYSTQSPSVLGNGWYAQVKNSGSGTITITPGSGTIDGNSNLVLNPGSSAMVATDGTNFYSLFVSNNSTFSYTRLVLSVAGSSNITLTSTEAAFSILSFTGALTGNINIYAPAAVTEWIVENNTTGSYTATFTTLAGTGVTLSTNGNIPAAGVNPCYCDGTNIRLGVTIPSAAIAGIMGGTGIVVGVTSSIATVSISSTGVSAGSYGDSLDIPSFIVNSQGQLTSASSYPLVSSNGNFTVSGNLAVTGSATFSSGTVSTSSNGGPLAGLRNRIINGDMPVSQRYGSSSITLTAGVAGYVIDRWLAVSVGANSTAGQTTGTGGNRNAYQINGAAGVTQQQFLHRIESINIYDLEGDTVTLSAVLANSLLNTITWAAYYANSTNNFSAVTSIASGSFTVTETPTKYSAQISLPSGAENGVEIMFYVGAQTSGYWTVTDVQLEQGTVATPYERLSYGLEYLLCCRYCYVVNSNYPIYAGAYQMSGFGAANFTYFPTPMLGAPTIIGLTSTGLPTVSAGNITPTGFALEWTSSGNYNSGTFYYQASAEL